MLEILNLGNKVVEKVWGKKVFFGEGEVSDSKQVTFSTGMDGGFLRMGNHISKRLVSVMAQFGWINTGRESFEVKGLEQILVRGEEIPVANDQTVRLTVEEAGRNPGSTEVFYMRQSVLQST